MGYDKTLLKTIVFLSSVIMRNGIVKKIDQTVSKIFILFPIMPFLIYPMPVQLHLLLLAFLQFRLTLRNHE